MRFDHESLLTLARKVHAAADDGDRDHLEKAARQFVEALASHLDEERMDLQRLSPPDDRILRRGQARVVTAASSLVQDAARGCSETSGACSARAEQLLALLVLQARDERMAWQHLRLGSSRAGRSEEVFV